MGKEAAVDAPHYTKPTHGFGAEFGGPPQDQLLGEEPSFTCPVCSMTSYNENDITEGFCGNCNDWTGDV